MIKIIVDKLFYGKLSQYTPLNSLLILAKKDAESILKELEDVGMYYCPVEDLGSMGKLRTPKGFEPVAKIQQELDDMVDRINDDTEFNKAIDKLINETGWDDETK